MKSGIRNKHCLHQSIFQTCNLGWFQMTCSMWLTHCISSIMWPIICQYHKACVSLVEYYCGISLPYNLCILYHAFSSVPYNPCISGIIRALYFNILLRCIFLYIHLSSSFLSVLPQHYFWSPPLTAWLVGADKGAFQYSDMGICHLHSCM